jgi:hypothetical protein
MDLAHKLILLQFDEVFRVYNEWIDLEDHVKLIPRDPNIRFDAVAEKRMAVLKFVVKVNEQEVVFVSSCIGGSFTGSLIDTGGRIATYGELADILSDITAEIYYQLVKYAEENNFPSYNIMH